MSIRPRLKILIPATQVLLLIAGAVWHNLMWQRFAGHEMATRYAVTPLDLLAKLNFPLLLAWLPFLYPLKFGLASSRLNLPAGASAFLTGLLDLAILLSVALFWHIAVAEVQARRHGVA